MIYDEFLEKTVAYEKSGTLTSAAISMEDQKKLDRLSCAMVTILTCTYLILIVIINLLSDSFTPVYGSIYLSASEKE